MHLKKDRNMMCYKFIVFYFIFATTRVRADADSKFEYEDCVKVLHLKQNETFCCKSLGSKENLLIKPKDALACQPTDGKWTCKQTTCIMEKTGMFSNGEVNEEGIIALLDKKYPADNPESKKMGDRVRDKCLKGRYKEYHPKDCVGGQIASCINFNEFLECQTWRDECKSIAESAAKCKAAVDA